VPIKTRNIGPIEISCVLNIVFSELPNGVHYPGALLRGREASPKGALLAGFGFWYNFSYHGVDSWRISNISYQCYQRL